MADEELYTLTVRGSDFVDGASLVTTDPSGTDWPSHDSRLTFHSSTRITYEIMPPYDTDGRWSVVVINPDDQVSNSGTFTVDQVPETPDPPDAPSLSSASCSSCMADEELYTLTVSGSDFVDGATLVTTDPSGTDWPSHDSRLTFHSTTKITYEIMPPYDTDGTWTVVVINPDDQVSNSQTFTVDQVPSAAEAPPPAPTALSPGSSSGPGDEISSLTPTLDWSNVEDAASYRVSVRECPCPSGPLVVDDVETTSSSYNVPSGTLQEDEDYRWNVRSCNSAGCGDTWSNRLYFQTRTEGTSDPVPKLPTAPRNLDADAGDAQVTLTWSPPSDDGGASITSYRVFRGTSSGNHLIVTSGGCANLGNVLSCTDTDRTNGQTYYYIVSAVNSAGQGAPSNEASAVPTAPPALDAPALSNASCSSCMADEELYTLTVSGSDFVYGATLVTTDPSGTDWPSHDSRLTFHSTTKITYEIMPPYDTDGTWTVVVVNPDGQVSNSQAFAVIEPSVAPSPECRTNYSDRLAGVPVDAIVIHSGENPSFDSLVDDLRCNDRQVSAHYVVGDHGEVEAIVPEDKRAWHATYYNDRSIGIEMQGFAGESEWWDPATKMAKYEALAGLVRAIAERHGILLTHPNGVAGDWHRATGTDSAHGYSYSTCVTTPVSGTCDHYHSPLNVAAIVGHDQVQPLQKSDPGPYFDWELLLQLVDPEQEPPAPPPPRPASLDYRDVWWPVSGTIKRGFFACFPTEANCDAFHAGIDIPGSLLAPVHASFAGTVRTVDSSGSGDYGKYIVVAHDDGLHEAVYGHLCRIDVTMGSRVQQGAVIGGMGNTGLVTRSPSTPCDSRDPSGTHLHFETRHQPKGTDECRAKTVPGLAIEEPCHALGNHFRDSIPGETGQTVEACTGMVGSLASGGCLRLNAVETGEPVVAADDSELSPEPRGTGYFFIHGICSVGTMWTDPEGNGHDLFRIVTGGGTLPARAVTYGPVDRTDDPERLGGSILFELTHFLDHGRPDGGPLADVVIVGHSNGGLMARWILYDDRAEGIDERISRVVTLDSPDRGADLQAWEYEVLESPGRALVQPPCEDTWADWSVDHLDQNSGDVSWIDEVAAGTRGDPRLIRFLFAGCADAGEPQRGPRGAQRPETVECRTGNRLVGENAADADGAFLLSDAPDPNHRERVVAAACTRGGVQSGASLRALGFVSSLTGDYHDDVVRGLYHVEGPRFFALEIAGAVRGGLTGFLRHAGTYDCKLLSEYGAKGVAGVVTAVPAGTEDSPGLATTAQSYQDGVTLGASISATAIDINVDSESPDGKVIVVRAHEDTWGLVQARDLVVELDDETVPLAAGYEQFRANVEARGDAQYFASLGADGYEFVIFVPHFSERRIEISVPVADDASPLGGVLAGAAVLLVGLAGAILFMRSRMRAGAGRESDADGEWKDVREDWLDVPTSAAAAPLPDEWKDLYEEAPAPNPERGEEVGHRRGDEATTAGGESPGGRLIQEGAIGQRDSWRDVPDPSPSPTDPTRSRTMYAQPLAGKRRSFGRGLGLILVTFGFYILYWHYRALKEIHDQERSTDFPDGLFVASFIPFVNIVCMPLYMSGFLDTVNTVRFKRDLPPIFSLGGFLAWYMLVPVAGPWVAYSRLQNAINEYWDFEAGRAQYAAGPPAAAPHPNDGRPPGDGEEPVEPAPPVKGAPGARVGEDPAGADPQQEERREYRVLERAHDWPDAPDEADLTTNQAEEQADYLERADEEGGGPDDAPGNARTLAEDRVESPAADDHWETVDEQAADPVDDDGWEDVDDDGWVVVDDETSADSSQERGR